MATFATEFTRTRLPERFCNLDRLLHSMEARGLDGVVASTANNVFYLSGFNGIAHKSDEPRPYAVALSRHAPDHPVLVVADYYLGSIVAQPTWIEDVRSFRAVMMPLDLASDPGDVDRFIPAEGEGLAWMSGARRHYARDLGSALRGALADLGLATGRVAFDDLGLGHRLGLDAVEIADGYDTFMGARAIKTPTELSLLRRATRLNQTAIERTIGAWERGMSWQELNHVYHQAAVGLGGFVRDPGAMIWGHPRGTATTHMLASGFEDFEVEPGLHVMFDCHGTLDLYCWDGGKTWVVDGEPSGDAKRYAVATSNAAEAVLGALRPGATVSGLQAAGREAFRKSGVPDADSALVYFHGLGLSHMDLEQTTAQGRPNTDWTLESDMVVALHIVYPGDERHRSWVEEVAQVTPDGGKAFFDWGFDPITG